MNRGCIVNADIAKTRPDSYDSDTEGKVEDKNSDGDISEVESSNRCCNGNQWGMQTLLGPRDTHQCYTCKERMHGEIMCSIFENEEDHSGHMYCLKCGSPSVETPGYSYEIKPS